MTKAQQAIESWRMVELLRSQEGDSVEILCDNPDGLNAVVCCGGWTDFNEARFEGVSTFAALEAAAAAYENQAVPVEARPSLPADLDIIEALLADCEKWIKAARWRTMLKLTPEAQRAYAWMRGEHTAGNAVVVITDLLLLMDKAIRDSGAKTAAALQPSAQPAILRLNADGADYPPKDAGDE